MNIMLKNQNRVKKLLVAFPMLFLLHAFCYAQDCESTLEIQLKNLEGGYYSGQKISLVSETDGTTYSHKTNAFGKANFVLPCETKFKVTIQNYPDFKSIESSSGGTASEILTYKANSKMRQQLSFEMNEGERRQLDAMVAGLPDTVSFTNSRMNAPRNASQFFELLITVNDLNGMPLSGEQIILTGIRRNKSFKGSLDQNGQALLYLPKGDTFSVNFLYHKRYAYAEHGYTRGTAKDEMGMTYIGTREMLRRKKEEELRIIAEEKRLKEEKERFAKECLKKKITIEEGYKIEIRKTAMGTMDTVITAVMNRNKWKDKLIVCDLTGSMNPYTQQLAIWYQLNCIKEPNLQFIFFNDGDGMSDHKKVIGSTGGIYYLPPVTYDKLAAFMAHVSARGDGGDCPENNMEALIKGVKMANPFKELIMIVDNHAPVKDIELLKSFNHPVHIILCGAPSGIVLTDYLEIAWKTKGSIHTIEQDITSIAKMSEGEVVRVKDVSYKIMGGEFVMVPK